MSQVVFASETVRHEPDRLINSSIWSESLFPAGIVKEIRDTAAKADKSLIQKWGMHPTEFDKRKGYGDMGPPKKKLKYNFKLKDLQKGSPAFNAKYENRPPSFRGGYQGGKYKPRNKGDKFNHPSNYQGGYHGGYQGGNRG